MMHCEQCKYFIKTYEGEGWCSNPKYSGILIFTMKSEPCRGNGYVKGNESPQYRPPAIEESPRTPSQ